METIISYIDNLFGNYPDTPQARKAREELLGIMEDKYNELKAEGKSEHEAIGIVISEFGSMDEIAAELGPGKKITIEKKEEAGSGNEKMLTLTQAQEYLNRQADFGFKVAVGVALCILSPVLPCILETMREIGIIPEALSEAVGGASLFFMIAVAVGIFITSGVSISRYDDYKKSEVKLDARTRERITEQYDVFNQYFGVKIAAGVILCILSVVPPLFVSAFLGSGPFYWVEQLSGIGLFAFVAIGVFLFVTEGMKKDAYEVLLGKGEYRPKRAMEKKGKKLTELIASIYWPIVAAIYLVWSIITMEWGFTWIIWPVSGIIFGAISAAISIICRAE